MLLSHRFLGGIRLKQTFILYYFFASIAITQQEGSIFAF